MNCTKCDKNFKSKGGLTKHNNLNKCINKNIEQIENQNEDTIHKINENQDTNNNENKDIIKEKSKIKLKKPNNNTIHTIQEIQEINDYYKKPINEIIFELSEEQLNDSKEKAESKDKILKIIEQTHNLLYDNENIVGEQALNDIMCFIFLKLIENHLSDKDEKGKIDLLNTEYYEDLYADKKIEDLHEVLDYFRNINIFTTKEFKNNMDKFNSLRNVNDTIDIIRKMGEILTTHKLTKNIFNNIDIINIKNPYTIVKLLKILNKIDFVKLVENEDVIGDIYEYFINTYTKTGSKMGQFFTPRIIMKLLLNYKEKELLELKNKIINEEEKKEIKIYDPCMGTGGWIISLLNLFKNNYEGNELNINYVLSGCDITKTTFQYGLMNLMISSNKMPEDVYCDSSLTHVNNNKHHFIMTNPPFNSAKSFSNLKKNFDADKYTTTDNKIIFNDIYKLNNNNPCIQFIELNIYKLEENGICYIILPYGQIFFGNSYKKIRKYFMDIIDIKEIIIFENGVFTHTDILTCVMIFVKDKNGTKEIKFSKTSNDSKKIIHTATITKKDILNEKNYSWYIQSYLKENNNNIFIDSNKKILKINTICNFLQKINRKASYGNEEGKYPFFTSSNKIKSYIDNPDYNEESIIIGTGGAANVKYSCNFSCSSDNIIIKSKDENIYLTKYIYYYLLHNINILEEGFKGCTIKHISKEYIENIEIPIDNIEKQLKIVNYFNNNIDSINKILESNILLYNNINSKIDINFNINKKIKISDIFIFSKKINRKASYGNEEGKYPFFTSSSKIKSYIDNPDYNEESIIIGTGGKANVKYSCNFSCSSDNIIIKSKDENIYLTKYIYYYLLHNINILEEGFKGCTIKHISKEYIENIEVPNIDIVKQRQLINEIDYINNHINNNNLFIEKLNYNNKDIFKM